MDVLGFTRALTAGDTWLQSAANTVYSPKLTTSAFEKQSLLCFTLLHRSEPSNGHSKNLSWYRRWDSWEQLLPFFSPEFPGRQERRSSAGMLLPSSNRSFSPSCKHLNTTAASPKNLQAPQCSKFSLPWARWSSLEEPQKRGSFERHQRGALARCFQKKSSQYI